MLRIFLGLVLGFWAEAQGQDNSSLVFQPQSTNASTSSVVTNSSLRPELPCQCLGQLSQQQALLLLNRVCRNRTLINSAFPESGQIIGSKFVPSKARCGTTSPDNPSPDNLCFCNGIDKAANKTFWMTIRLTMEPWEWSGGDLANFQSRAYQGLQMDVQRTIDVAFLKWLQNSTVGFVQSHVSNFASSDPTQFFTAPNPSLCPRDVVSSWNAELPDHLAVAVSGSRIRVQCSDPSKALVSSDNGTIKSSVTADCSRDILTGLITSWPKCITIQGSCGFPANLNTSNSLAGDAQTRLPFGQSRIFRCRNSSWTINATTAQQFFAVRCDVASGNTSGNYSLLLYPAQWPNCVPDYSGIPATTPNHNIQATVAIQFHGQMLPSSNEVMDVMASLPQDLESASSFGISLNSNFTQFLNGTLRCSNDFASSLSARYEIRTQYWSLINQTNVSAEVLATITNLEAGDLVELICKDDKMPLQDDWDSDSSDGIISTFCAATNPDALGSLALDGVAPLCVQFCPAPWPTPPESSGLTLVGFMSQNDGQTVNNITEDYIMSGDILVYTCLQNGFSLYGGVDQDLSIVTCGKTGSFEAPEDNFQSWSRWPDCQPMSNMVDDGVSQMLDQMYTKLSNRFKIVAFHDVDNAKAIIDNPNYIPTVTLPVAAGLILMMCICCFCSRNSSPICGLCQAPNHRK